MLNNFSNFQQRRRWLLAPGKIVNIFSSHRLENLKDQSSNSVIRERLLPFRRGAKESAIKLGNVIETEANNFQQRLPLQCHCRRLFWDSTATNPISAICPSVHRQCYVSCSSVSPQTFINYSGCHVTQCQLSWWTLGRGGKAFMERKLNRLQFFIIFPVKNVSLKENRDNTWSLHVLLAPAWFPSRLLHTVLTIPFPTVNWEPLIMFIC